jgi:hypothetical protein
MATTEIQPENSAPIVNDQMLFQIPSTSSSEEGSSPILTPKTSELFIPRRSESVSF